MGREHALDGVERSRDDHRRAVRHPVRVQVRPGDARELRIHGDVTVEDRLPAPRAAAASNAGASGGSSTGSGLPLDTSRTPAAHIHTNVVPSRRGGGGPHPAAPAPGGLDDPPLAQDAVRGRDGVRVHAELDGQLSQRWQEPAGLQLPRAHRMLDAGRDLGCTPTLDPISS